MSAPPVSFKDTLLLPRTDFPMKAGLTAREPEALRRWQETDLYGRIQAARADAPEFLLHDGPPFANGDVHMGTALNKVLKDFVVKSKTMAGHRAPFLPGWDCHGLPIEFKVVKEARGLSPLEVRRRSEELARKFIGIMTPQFERLGVLGDWAHPYRTLDPAYEAAILRAFAGLVERRLVYQSLKPVYWSTGAQTALAEAEVEYHERDDPAIYVRFPLVSGPLAGRGSAVIWTTTPWTLPANVAITVNPAFRYSARPYRHPETGELETFLLADGLAEHFANEAGWQPAAELAAEPAAESWLGAELEHWRARHPFLDRDSVLILGEHVTLDAGTGLVHTAPGHGAEDYVVGRKYGLPVLSPVDDLGRFTADGGGSNVPAELVGKYVFDANQDVLEILRGRGALLGAKVYHHTYPHCWRSKTPIVFRAVEQFFIRMDDLRPESLRAIDTVRWLPPWGRNRIYGTVEARPDWCISRQRAWGVPVPVFYDAAGQAILRADWIEKVAQVVEKHGTNPWFDPDDRTIADALGPEGAGVTRRFDTLDVWIDSGTSWRAVVEGTMRHDGPADLYLEATDQHRGWFQSSLVTSVALTGRAPYKDVLTHGWVVNVDGSKLSKSKGALSAESYVNRHGADILRLWCASVNFTDEVPFGEEMFTRLGDTYRRIRNTLRILLGNLADFDEDRDTVSPDQFTAVDTWMMHRLQEVIQSCREAYAAFEFHKVYHTLNGLCAVDLSSLYVDITKDRMYCDAENSPRRRATQTVMRAVFSALCRLLAPIIPFTAEEAWGYFDQTDSVHLELFPTREERFLRGDVAARVEQLLRLRGLISQEVERARQEKLIGNALEARVVLAVADPALRDWLAAHEAEAAEFFILSHLVVVAGDVADAATLTRTAHARCERCWRHRPTVGREPRFPTLCDRCAEVVAGRGLC